MKKIRDFFKPLNWPITSTQIFLILLFCAAYQGIEAWIYFSKVSNGLDGNNCRVGGDFVNIWTAARLVLEHNLAPLFDYDAYEIVQKKLFGDKVAFHNWSYPPHMLPWIVPLGLLPYPVALALWTILTFSLYALAVCWKRPGGWRLVPILLLAPASFENIHVGQNAFWMAALMVGGLRLLERKPSAAGILFGILTFKPHFGLLVPVALFAAREWKAFAAAAATGLALFGFSVALFGIDPWVQYFHVTAPYQKAILELPTFPEVRYYMQRMPSFFIAARILGFPIAGAYLLAGITALGMMSVAYSLFARVPAKAVRGLRNPMFLTAALIAVPYAFNFDMTLVTAAAIGFLDWKGPKGRLSQNEMTLLAGVWFIPSVIFILHGARLPVAPFIVLAFFMHMLTLYEQPPEKP